MKYISKENKIFIAGHRGMVGSAIFRNFKKNGYLNLLTVKRVDLDLTDTSSVKKWYEINRPDVVVIAAAKVGGILANSDFPTQFLLDNLKIQNNLIESALENDVSRLLFLGSSCIYPKFASQPIKEESLLSDSLEDTNQWYAIAKIAGIKLCEAFSIQYGFDAISLMPTNLYGPGDYYHPEKSHVIPALIRKFDDATKNNLEKVVCWGTGSPLREFLYVDDLADACKFVLENWKPNKDDIKYLNVGCGMDMQIKKIAEIVAKKCGFFGEISWDISKPDGTGTLKVTRLTLDEDSMSCDFEGQVEGYGSVFISHEYRYTMQEKSGGTLTGEANTFLEDGTHITAPHLGTFTQDRSKIRIYFTDLVNNGAVNFVIWDIDILTKDVDLRYWEVRAAD